MIGLGSHSSESMGDNNFLARAILYGRIGLLLGLRGSKLANLAFFGPFAKVALGFKLEEALYEIAKQEQEKERQKRAEEIMQNWAASMKQVFSERKKETGEITKVSLLRPLVLEKDNSWLKTVIHPSVVLVLGKRGSGKSALGYRLLELFRYRLTPHVIGIPTRAQKLLPDWIGVDQELDEIPQASIVLIDEAYLSYHSRESFKTKSKEMSQLVNLSRQRNQTLIFITQEARQIDKNIASQANVVVFKEPAILQSKFERPELNDIIVQAKLAFSDLSGDKRGWAYVYSPDADFIGLMESALPTLWSIELSHAFATGDLVSGTRLPKSMTREEKRAEAKELHKNGLSYRKIGDRLDINEGTAYNYVNDYPYKK
jgi:predicted AAA+ superfamily ATPase